MLRTEELPQRRKNQAMGLNQYTHNILNIRDFQLYFDAWKSILPRIKFIR